MGILSKLSGYKTYLSAAGLVGLGVFQFSSGDIPGGIQSLLAAAAAASLRSAVATTAAAKPAVPAPAGMAGRGSTF